MKEGMATRQVTQGHFARERHFVELLRERLRLQVRSIENPNIDARETGVDVRVHLIDGSTIGIQVTEIDPHPKIGTARAGERRAQNNHDIYGDWGQNDLHTMCDAFARTISRKADIAAQHPTQEDKTWLLICGGVPDAPASTFVMSQWLSPLDVNNSTNEILQQSKFDECFFFPIIAGEPVLYRWQRGHGWKKSVGLDEASQEPNEAYVKDLFLAANPNDWTAVDSLCDKECRRVLLESRSP